MKIIVTGGSGFIGTNLVDFYLRKGWEVLNLDIREPRQPAGKGCWKKCDILSYDSLNKAFQSFRPDYIVHLAARTDLDGQNLEDYAANTQGIKNVLQAAAQLNGLKKILITSSMLVCHTGYIPKDQHDYAPTTRYGESKVVTEKLVWENPPKCDWALLRPTSIWGPWFGVPYRNFFEQVRRHHYVHLGHRSCTKTYGYVENTVYQIDCILTTPTTAPDNKVFYLGDEPAVFIEEWANQIAAQLGFKIPRVPFWTIRCAALFGDTLTRIAIPFPMTSFRLRNMTTDNIVPLENTRRIAPSPPVNRITGIRRTLEWMDRHHKA